MFWLSLFVLICTTVLDAQPPDTLWRRVYPEMREAYAIEATPDGGYIIAGMSVNYLADGCLLKIDSLGNQEWLRGYGGYDTFEYFYDVCVTSDGDYVALGYAHGWPSLPTPDVYAVKVTPNGDTVWTRTYDFDHRDAAYAVKGTSDGGCFVAGETGYIGPNDGSGDILVLKVSASGDEQWHQRYGASVRDVSFGISDTSADGSFYLCGIVGTEDDNDSTRAFLLKTNAGGDSVWMHTYQSDEFTYFEHLELAAENGVFACGFTEDAPYSQKDIAVFKIDSLGSTIRSRTYGGDQTEIAYALALMSDGGVVVFGDTRSFGLSDFDNYVLRVDANGDTLWTGIYGVLGNEINSDGLVAPDGGIIILGFLADTGGAYLWKTRPVTAAGSSPRFLLPTCILVSAYPNPFNSSTQIRFDLPRAALVNVTIFDVLGWKVETLLNDTRPAGSHHVEWNVESQAAGIYFARLKAGPFTQTMKLMLLK